MAEPIEHAAADPGFRAGRAAGRQLVIGTLEDLRDAAIALRDLRTVGFNPGEFALIASVADTRSSTRDTIERLGLGDEASIIDCRGLGRLLVGGGAIASLRALGEQTSLPDLGRAFADAGLPDADALIYELSLIRGQCLLAVRAVSTERVQIAYRLLLRCGSREVHAYNA